MSESHIFPDVNVLLHFPAFDGLDWCSFCKAKSVVIHLTQPLFSELNKVKDTGHSKSVRKRAGSVQRRLKDLLKSDGLSMNINPNVTLLMEARSPRIADYPELNSAVADDLLVAAILSFCRETGMTAKLATDDDGFALMVKAAQWDIEVIEPPLASRLPPEADAADKEKEELRRRLIKVESARPLLKLTFVDDKTTLHIAKTEIDIEASVASNLNDLHAKHQKLEDPRSPKRNEKLTLGRLAMLNISIEDMARNDPKEVARYNEELDEFFAAYEQTFRENLAIEARKLEVQLQVHNAGAVPAKDVLVEMHFPDGFRLFGKKNIWRIQ